MTQSGVRSFSGHGTGGCKTSDEINTCNAVPMVETSWSLETDGKLYLADLRRVDLALGTTRRNAFLFREFGCWHKNEEAGKLGNLLKISDDGV